MFVEENTFVFMFYISNHASLLVPNWPVPVAVPIAVPIAISTPVASAIPPICIVVPVSISIPIAVAVAAAVSTTVPAVVPPSVPVRGSVPGVSVAVSLTVAGSIVWGKRATVPNNGTSDDGGLGANDARGNKESQEAGESCQRHVDFKFARWW